LVNLKKRYDKENLDKEYFEKKIDQATEQIQYLSKTINDFKEFYFPEKNREIFLVKESIENALSIISADLKKHNVECTTIFNIFEDIKIFGIKNELSQVVLAIVSNSIDALKDMEKPIINIEISTNDAE
jgi:C4-dicarboxylate-specific signal transduction histidine kinase